MTLLWENVSILFDNSLHFSLGPFKAQLHLILKTANLFQLSCSIPFTALLAPKKAGRKKEASQAGLRNQKYFPPHLFKWNNLPNPTLSCQLSDIFQGLRKGLGQRGVLDLTFCDRILSLVRPRTDNAVFHYSKGKEQQWVPLHLRRDCSTGMLSQSCKVHKNQVAKIGIKDVNIPVINICPLAMQVAFQQQQDPET